MNNISAAEGWNSVWPLLQRVDLSADEENTRKTIGARTRSSGALLICSLKGCCLQLLQASAISALRQRSLWSLCSPCDRNFMGNRPACRLWCPKKNAVVKKAGMVGVCDIAQRSFPNLLTLVAVTATARPWQNLKARGCERFVLRRAEERPFVTKECDFGRLGLLPLGCGCVTVPILHTMGSRGRCHCRERVVEKNEFARRTFANEGDMGHHGAFEMM